MNSPSRGMVAHAQRLLDSYRDHPRVTPTRWANLQQSVNDYLAGRETTSAVPYSLFIEASSHCNLRCPLCPTGAGELRRPAESLDFVTFENLIDELADRIIEVHFAFFGEPMTNRRLEDMVALAERANLDTRLMTNATMLTQSRALELVTAGLQRVTVSADAFEQEMYETYRRGGRASRMVSGIKNLVRARGEAAASAPVIEVQFLALRSNEQHLDTLTQRAFDLGADRVKIKRLSLDLAPTLTDDERRSYLPLEPTLRYYDRASLETTRPSEQATSCPSLYLEPGIVTAGGVTALCCRDPAAKYSYGDPREEGFARVWQGPALNKIRSNFTEPARRPEICTKCAILEQCDFQAIVLERSDYSKRNRDDQRLWQL